MTSPDSDTEQQNLFLIDPITQLQHYLALLPTLESWLREDGALGMLHICLSGLERIEELNGPKIYDQILGEVGKHLREMKGSAIRDEDLLSVGDIGGASFMIFLSEKRKDSQHDTLQKHDVEVIADRVQEHLFPHLFLLLNNYTRHHPRLMIGYSFVVHNPLIRVRRLIYRLIDEAKDMARLQQPRVEIKSKERLQRIILKEDIRTLFQPIIDFSTGKPVGYEALTRGPADTIFESPLMLFSFARETGLVFELDRLCRRRAMLSSKNLPSDCKIFINTLPNTIHDPEFRGIYLQNLLKDIEKKPSNVVFEITERAAIQNFSEFRDAMKDYIEAGMSIAIDDIGTGYSSLESIVELNPAYLKFDLSMVDGISESAVKQEMLRMLCVLADRIGAQVIAEGIETKEDLDTLKKLGVKFGQGFYFSKPKTVEELMGLTPEKEKKKLKLPVQGKAS